MPVQAGLALLVLAFVFWTVFTVLGHAEAVAHRIGEPFGTLVLTVAVTAIEVSVIVSVMLHGTQNPAIARESVFSTVMIVCAGMVGLCLVLGGMRHRKQEHNRQGTSALLAVIVALSVMTLVLPSFTLTAGPGVFSPVQLIFVSILCVLLYGTFVYGQMAGHREDFLDERPAAPPIHHVEPPRSLVMSLVLLAVGLIGIVLLAEHVAASLEEGLEALHLAQTDAIVGAFIATLVLMPEMLSAIRAARRNELQRSLNIALGSACATIGLTVPVVAAASLLLGHPLTLGLGSGDTVLLLLALAVSMVSLGTGRTTVMTGMVHLVVFVAYLMLIAVP
jgi:Ca2+:H+ antiporter